MSLRIRSLNGLGEHGLHLPVTQMKFPDGQVHVQVTPYHGEVEIIARIRNGDELLSVLLAEEAARHGGATKVHLFITYLLGARMDRRIGQGDAFTLKVVAHMLQGHFDHIRVLDPHSDVACALLDAEPVLPVGCVKECAQVSKMKFLELFLNVPTFAMCAPDAGASKRVSDYSRLLETEMVQCLKHRDLKTGQLSGFSVLGDSVPDAILITDDICDGGGTFVPLAKLLREKGALWVGLYVTHGIFSKGVELPGIDQIFTTRSYREEYPASVIVVDGGMGELR